MDLNLPHEDDLIAVEKFQERLKKGEIKNITPFQPLIRTTAEIIGFLMGDERKYLDKTLFFDARHQKAEQVDFLSAYYSVLDCNCYSDRPNSVRKMHINWSNRSIGLSIGIPVSRAESAMKFSIAT